jgi:hypothetical protein
MKRILALLVIWPALASAQTYNYQITSGSFIGLTGVLTFAGNGFTGGGFSPGMSTFGPLSLDGWTGSLSWSAQDLTDTCYSRIQGTSSGHAEPTSHRAACQAICVY